MGWSLADKIAAAAAIAGFLQFVVLTITVGVLILTARRQLRAYVFVELHENDRPTFRPEAEVRIPLRARNRGQTPAYRVSQWVDTQVLPFPIVGKFPPPDGDVAPASYLDLGPTQGEFVIVGQIPRALTAVELDGLKKGKMRIYVFGEIRYRDVFALRRGKRQPRYTQFRFMVHHGDHGQPLGLMACPDGNYAN
jgi:hypothetical protein